MAISNQGEGLDLSTARLAISRGLDQMQLDGDTLAALKKMMTRGNKTLFRDREKVHLLIHPTEGTIRIDRADAIRCGEFNVGKVANEYQFEFDKSMRTVRVHFRAELFDDESLDSNRFISDSGFDAKSVYFRGEDWNELFREIIGSAVHIEDKEYQACQRKCDLRYAKLLIFEHNTKYGAKETELGRLGNMFLEF